MRAKMHVTTAVGFLTDDVRLLFVVTVREKANYYWLGKISYYLHIKLEN